MQDWIKEWVEEHRREVLLALLGAILIGSGVFWMKSGGIKETEVQIVRDEKLEIRDITVDVSGEVNKPGVYKLSGGARVEEALAVAGGLTGEADTNYIEKYLNRAMRLLDGQKIYIPRIDAENAQSFPQSGIPLRGTMRNAQLNINTASQAELEGLPGIGSERAAKIVSNRPYQNISELLSKKIVGQKVYDQIKDQISVW